MSARKAEQRRFPRVRCRRAGELEVYRREGRAASGRGSFVLPVIIRTMTCEGVGLTLSERNAVELARGARVAIRFELGGHTMQLPGAVAWYKGYRDPAQPLDLGIRLCLRSTEPATSRTYASWIVDILSKRMNRDMELGVILMQVARVPLDTLQRAHKRHKRTWRSLGDILLEMNAITSYELRMARSCRLICAEDTVPASLLAWQRSLEQPARERGQ